jgi:hypothetical protein
MKESLISARRCTFWRIEMAFENRVAAWAVLLVIPGPTILPVISHALGRGWRRAPPIAVGVAPCDPAATTRRSESSMPAAFVFDRSGGAALVGAGAAAASSGRAARC